MTKRIKKQSKRVCIRDVAEVCGVSAMTVSNALRGAHRVSPPTRRRIIAAADRLGYQPDPELSRTMAKLRGERIANAPSIAWVDGERSVSPGDHLARQVFCAAECRAQERGFVLSCLSLSGEQISSSRVSDILYARGVDFGIFTPTTEPMATAWEAAGKTAGLWMVGGSHVSGLPRVDFADVSDYVWGFQKLATCGYRQLLVHPSSGDAMEAALFEAALHRCRGWFASVCSIGEERNLSSRGAVAEVSLRQPEAGLGLPLYLFGESSLPTGAGGFVRDPARLGRAVIDALAQQYLNRMERDSRDILLRADWQAVAGGASLLK